VLDDAATACPGFCPSYLGPAGFAALVRLCGGWDLPLLLVAAQFAVASLLMALVLRRARFRNPDRRNAAAASRR
jgi:hypothetical protein